jgi:plasmid stabilization system protein ParE
LGSGSRTPWLDTVERIAANPEWYPRVSGGIRKCRVPRFPYGVLYRFNGEQVDILVVMHLHRQPGFWKKRIKSSDADE